MMGFVNSDPLLVEENHAFSTRASQKGETFPRVATPPKPDQPDWKSTQAENHSIMKYTAPDQTMEWVSDL